LADDSSDILNSIREMLDPQFDVVATVQDGYSLIAAIKKHKPDVVVTDISMPGLSGIEATREIIKLDPDSRIVLLTVHRESAIIDQGFAAGALGYVLKLNAGEELIPAVNEALQGHHFVSASLCQSVAHH